MRIDVFLKKTLILKKRNQAKDLCNKQLIRVNGRAAKPSKPIAPGDIIEIETLAGTRSLRILELPTGNVTKGQASRYYEERTGV